MNSAGTHISWAANKCFIEENRKKSPELINLQEHQRHLQEKGTDRNSLGRTWLGPKEGFMDHERPWEKEHFLGVKQTWPESTLSVLLSVVVANSVTKSHLGRKGLISCCCLQCIIKGSQGRHSRQELKVGKLLCFRLILSHFSVRAFVILTQT